MTRRADPVGEPPSLDAAALRSPPFTAADAVALAAPWFGAVRQAVELGSHQDRNFLVTAADGRRGVLKIANPAFGRAALELANAAMRHVAGAGLPFATPHVMPTGDGRLIVPASRESRTYDVRVVSYVDGVPLFRLGVLPRSIGADLGRVAAEVAAALAGFSHPAAGRAFQWSPDAAPDVISRLVATVDDPRRRGVVERVAQRVGDAAAAWRHLRRQVIHGDVTEYNVIARPDEGGAQDVVGLVDFGDVVEGPLVGEAAVAAAAAVRTAPRDALAAIVDATHAFHATTPLRADELAALFPLVLARTAVGALSTSRQWAVEPRNTYVAAAADHLWSTVERVAAVPSEAAEAALRQACGHDPCPHGRRVRPLLAAARSVPVVELQARPVTVDLSARSDRLTAGAWRTPAGIAAAVRGGAGELPVGRWGEARLIHGEPGDREPATVHLGADLFVDAGTEVRAPLAGAVERVGDRELLLRHELSGDTPVWLRLAGLLPSVASGTRVAAGAPVGTVDGHAELLPPHLHVQLCLAPVEALPGLAHASQRTAWLALCPDPSALVGVAVAAPAEDAQATRAARRRHIAAAQQLYYDDPPEMVRGWRQHLYDLDGRAYLDVVNNVAVVGHSHPRVAEAAGRQLQLLNTNSRFLYAALGRYAARLVELLPAPLDTVFLVNSGSEANDLALRVARAATDRRDVVVLEGAYHGWTTATVELTTSPFYPGTAATDVPGRHVVAAPNPYRGPYGEDDPDAGRRYADLVRGACEAAAHQGAGVAAFISEPQLGNAGGVIPPAGYLGGAYAHVRAAGGVCIADEVQVGFGRLGTWFWAFEQQDAIPDIVTVAKPAGNGFPLGAVITSRAIAERFARRTTLFSSVGGSPLSCEVGIAVLDVIRDERLQDNARLVGARLRTGLEELARRHELVGAVHGLGLHLGVELVGDRDTKAPATRAAAAVCERLLERGVIVRPTGDQSNVLKVKPPLCFDAADADRLVDSLDRVLARPRRVSPP